MVVEKAVNPRFENYIFDWDYRTYLLVGGYGSSKSYNTALKLVLKLTQEKRKALVVREVFDTLRDSCYDLLVEILIDLGIYGDSKNQVRCTTSPMKIRFPNGSTILFKGMDKPEKLKSINGVTIVWLEECSEIKYAGYKELLGRLRHPTDSIHFLLTTNPVGTETWVYTHFFKSVDSEGRAHVVLDDQDLYKRKTIVRNGVYYHHSVADDNKFLPKSYIDTLDDMQRYDPDLWRVARLGRFGINGRRVLPQFEVAPSHSWVMQHVARIPSKYRFNGMDFGFEESYNAVLRVAVDDAKKDLYIYWEYYKNKMTDDKTAKELIEYGMDKEQIVADCEDPKAIQFYRQTGFRMRGCHKFAGSRLANTRKIKRFHHIYCSPECKNTIRELSTLVYAKEKRTDELIYDEFNIDPHTFSALWYALDNYTVADVKEIPRNTRKGG